MKKIIAILAFLFLFCHYNYAQHKTSFKEYKKEYLTYPFSDPNPIPPNNKIYPYFRYDGFTENAVKKEWKVVELENDYIKIQIMPEIGGKIWTAIDKQSGKNFLYNNDVVKFRDIALRGPWVSGGIEFNYGIIGHTPNSATPVDYLIKENPDGSVSCYISTLDLLTRTRWVLEIKLEKDKAYFTTNSCWFNSNPVERPYYTWMNSAIPASKDLKFLYPGNHYIGHDGSMHNWPLDSLGRDLSQYSQNDFGGSKSYHVFGVHSDYFGGYWKDTDFGMIHYAKRGAKLGKKIFLWAQSEQGRIWEDLLTDNSGQYVEMQSGRLFNQNQFESSFTPFKQIGFAPYNNDRWTEYWFPFEGINGFTSANPLGAFNIESNPNNISVKISPVQPIQDSLRVYTEEGKQLASLFVKAKPLESFTGKISITPNVSPAYLELKGYRVDLSEDKTKKNLNRPLKTPKSFVSESAYGLYLQGRDLHNFRNYQLSEEKIKASLLKAPLFIPSLVEMAKLQIFNMKYDSAFYYTKKALSINTYDGAANYYYGLSASKLSRYYDALDGYEVAALSPEWRDAAYTALSDLYMKRNNFRLAEEYARLSLQNNPQNMEALQLLHVLARIKNDDVLLNEIDNKIRTLNPLNHFIRFETYYMSQTAENKKEFTKLIRNEMPVETFLELAIWYANKNRIEESKKVLQLAPKNIVGLYWLAWLNRNENTELSDQYMTEAHHSSVDFVFPFRKETATVLEWASKGSSSWKPDYLLALIQNYRGNTNKAFSLLTKQKNINFAPFYILKAQTNPLTSMQERLEYIKKAVKLAPEEWRYGKILANTFSQLDNNGKAVEVLEKYYKADPSNYIIGLDLIKTYIQGSRYQDAERILKSIHVLPFEGANDARGYYRETKLMLAYKAMKKNNFQESLKKIDEAEEWPNSLGVGKPYQAMIENDIENAMKAFIYKKMGDTKLQEKYIKRVEGQNFKEESFLEKIEDISSKKDTRIF